MDLKAKILEAARAASKSNLTPVKAWGVDAYIKEMSGTERDAFEGQIFDAGGKVITKQFRARLLVKTLADANGDRVFTEDEITALSDAGSLELDRLYEIASKANGLKKEDVDELTKNS